MIEVTREDGPFCQVNGVFFRAIDPRFAADALAGSRLPARYSRIAQPTLYLSATPEGVEAALRAHSGSRAANRRIARVAVAARRICDLRDRAACRALGVDAREAALPWQDVVARGATPPSWLVRDAAEAAGAAGLIDPSRTAPGLWHLVLFGWNRPGQPEVKVLEGA